MNRFEFHEDDLFINRLKTYPEYNISIYRGRTFINKENRLSGSGGLVVFDINRNKYPGTHQINSITPVIDTNARKDQFKKFLYQPMVDEYLGNNYYTNFYSFRLNNASNATSVYPAIGGPDIVSSYGNESPITRRLTTRVTANQISYYHLGNGSIVTQNVPINAPASFGGGLNVTASALQNVARKYTVLSDHFIFVSSTSRPRDLVYPGRDEEINFIFIPQMYYGTTIKKGSVSLSFNTTGSVTAKCEDRNRNGVLIETTGSNVGKPVGLVLYDEGVIMLTASHDFNEQQVPPIRYSGTAVRNPSWLFYGVGLNDDISHSTLSLASFDLNFKGTNYINTMTMFAHAEKGQLNHSNNPTYRDLNYSRSYETGSGIRYYESESDIKNITSGSYYTSASFEKTTYISKINIYDENYNLIGVTKLAKPVKKTLERSYTFKMKLDL